MASADYWRFYPLAAFALFLSSFLIFTPGIISPDYMDQWQQVLRDKYNSWHPPIMAWTWHWLYHNIWLNMAVMHLFYLLLFWSGAYVMGLTLKPVSVWLGFGCIGLWFTPPVMEMTATSWKDTGMAYSWFLASALMLHYSWGRKQPGVIALLVIGAMLFYGTAVRYDAVAGLLPLCYWLTVCIRGRQDRWRTNTLITIAIFCGLVAASLAFNKAATGDLVRTHRDTKQTNILDHLMVVELWKVAKPPYVLKDSNITPAEAFMNMLMQQPGDYLGYRWEKFAGFLNIENLKSCTENTLDISVSDSSSLRALSIHYLRSMDRTLWFNGLMWLVMVTGACVFSLLLYRRYREEVLPALVMNLSGWLYFLSHYFTAYGCSFRYIYWPVLACAYSLLIVTAVIIKNRNAHPQALP